MARAGKKRLIVGLGILAVGGYIFWNAVARGGFLQSSAMQGAGIGLLGLALTALGLAKLVHKAVGGAFFAAVAALGGFLYFRGHSEMEERMRAFRAEQAIRDQLWLLCQEGKPVPEAAAFDAAAPGIHPVVILQKLSDGNRIDVAGKPGWFPKDLASAQLVVCADMNKRDHGSCQYTDKDGNGLEVSQRYQYVCELRVLKARDGATVATKTIEGSMPAECPDSKAFGKYQNQNIDGSYPTDDQIRELLVEHVE